MTKKKGDVLTPDQLFARHLRESREAQNLSQAELAERMNRLGVPIDRVTILKIERAGRPDSKAKPRQVTVGEALAFSYALEESPLNLFTPRGDERLVLGDRALDDAAVREWLGGGLTVDKYARQFDELEEKIKLALEQLERARKY